jgi:sugar lactone lactonase YvrE
VRLFEFRGIVSIRRGAFRRTIMTDPVSPHCAWALAAQLGEGPIWSPGEDAVWFVDIKKNRIHRFEPSTRRKRSYETPPSPSFIVAAAAGAFVVGLQSGLHRFDPRSGDFTVLCEVEPELPGNRLNDGALDPSGRLWFGTMDDAETEKSGSLYRLDRDGPVRVDSGYAITNGPCFSPDGRLLYHTDTRAGTIYAFDLDHDGNATNKRVFVRIEDGAGHPDGSVTDSEGCVWVCLFHGAAARRYSPAGELLSTVHFPCSNITKLAFGGSDLRTAYATSARHHLSDEQLGEQPLAGGLFSFTVEVPGLAPGVLHV